MAGRSRTAGINLTITSRPMTRTWLFITAVLLFTGSPGQLLATGVTDFLPRFMDSSGEVVLKGMTDGRNVKSDKRSSNYTDTNLQEFLRLKGVGFMYSPNFISLLSDFSVGLQQEKRSTDNLSYRQNNGLFQFRQELMVLPNHPYNLHLYGGRSDEIVSGMGGRSSSAVVYEWGARARYRQRPWQSMLNYTHFETASSWDSATDTFGANLYFFDTLTFWNVNTSYNHYLASRYNGQNNSEKDVFAAHISKKWDTFRFLSRWNLDNSIQNDRYNSLLNHPDYNEERKRREWYSEVAVDLPVNIRSLLSYRTRESNGHYQRGSQTGTADSVTDSYNLNFTHNLYKSLITSLNGGYTTVESMGGRTEQKDARLGSNYSKILRWGSVGASLSAGMTETGNVGQTVTLAEEHRLTNTSPTSFNLNSSQLDPDTVRLGLVDSFNDNMVVPLVRGIHFEVLAVGDSYRILIMALPPAQTEPWTEYRYLADYANMSSEYAIRGLNWGGTFKVSFLDKMVTTHAGYRESDQQVLSGAFPGILDNSKSYNLGVSLGQGSLRAEINQFWRRSVTENEDRFTAYLVGTKHISSVSGGSFTATYENRMTEEILDKKRNQSPKLTENIYSGHIQAFTSWPKHHIDGTLGMNYSFYNGLGESTTRSINSALTWHIGRMDINVRLSYHESESKVQDSRNSSDYYTAWLTIRRQIF